MRALHGVLLLALALSVLPSAAGALELGPCDPAKAVKIIDTQPGRRENASASHEDDDQSESVRRLQSVHHLHTRGLDDHARFIPKSL